MNSSSKLKYHGPHHTLDVMEALKELGRAEGLSEEDVMLVKAAALFHDSGFLNKYQDNESEGAKLAKRELPRYGFTETQVQRIENDFSHKNSSKSTKSFRRSSL